MTEPKESKIYERSKHFGYIYLIRTREFLQTNRHIYKLGRTEQNPNSRIKNYPPGSELVLSLQVDNCWTFEKAMKNKFDANYTKMRQYGHEYYKGNRAKMCDDIYELHMIRRDGDHVAKGLFHRCPNDEVFKGSSIDDYFRYTNGKPNEHLLETPSQRLDQYEIISGRRVEGMPSITNTRRCIIS